MQQEAQLRVHGLLELLIGRERRGVPGVRAELLAALEVYAVGQGELHHAAEVVVPGRTPLVMASGKLRLHAPDGRPVAGEVGGDALLEQHLVADLVAEDGREAGTGLHQLRDLEEELLGVLLAQAHGQRGLDHLDVDARLQHEVAQFVDGVAAIGVEAAQRDVLEGAETGIVLRGGLVPVPNLLAELHPQAFDDFKGVLVAQAAFPVLAVIGNQILIEQPRRIAARVALDEQADEDEIGELQGFVQGVRGIVGDPVAHGGDAFEVAAAGVVGPVHEFAGLLGVAFAQKAEPFAADDHGLPEITLRKILDVVEVQPGEVFGGLAPDAVEAEGQDELVKGRDHVAGGAFDLHVIVADAADGEQLMDILRSACVPEIPERLALPVGIDFLAVEPLLLFRDLVGVLRTGAHRVQFVVEPVVRELGIHMDAARHGPGVADDEFVRLDGDGLGFAVPPEDLGPADDHRLAFGFLKHAGRGQSAFDADARLVGKKLLLEAHDPFETGFLGERHRHSPFISNAADQATHNTFT